MQTFHICLWECTLAVGDVSYESSGKWRFLLLLFRKCCEEVESLFG